VRGNTESQSEAKSLLRPKLALQVMFPPHMAGNELPVKLLGLQFNVPDTCNPASKQNARSVSIDVSLPGTETSRVACFKRTRRQRIETVCLTDGLVLGVSHRIVSGYTRVRVDGRCLFFRVVFFHRVTLLLPRPLVQVPACILLHDSLRESRRYYAAPG
jgi:hypothetical protein